MGGTAVLRVFISYRRDDTGGHAGRLHDSLTVSMKEADVFMDVGDIEPGVDFAVAIADAIGSCDVMLALIGPRWTTATAADGSRRLDDPDDHVVAEIAAALERGVRVIPTLVDGAAMPEARALPARIVDLSRRNALSLSLVTWHSDMELVVAALRRLLPPPAPPLDGSPATAVGSTARPPEPPAGEEHHPRKLPFPRWAAAGAAIALLLIIVVAFAASEDGREPTPEAKQLLVEPEAGPPGTTLAITGGPCPRPAGWAAGQINYGLHDPGAPDEASENPDKDEVTPKAGAPWRGELTIPTTASPGPFFVYANCWAQDPNGQWMEFDAYEPVEFTVE